MKMLQFLPRKLAKNQRWELSSVLFLFSGSELDVFFHGTAVSTISGFKEWDLDSGELVPPPNFSLVWQGVYRSSFPREDHFKHLKSLRLKSILTLVPEMYPEANIVFMKENGIKHHQVSMPGNKEPFVKIPPQAIKTALGVILDRRNHPVLIHCNKGKHRTGCVVGCLRKLQMWALSSIFQEYRDHAEPKARLLDEQFIDLFDERSLLKLARQENWVPRSVGAGHAATGNRDADRESAAMGIKDVDGRMSQLRS
ncbi:hypothetical protein GP486_004641 [Trichoglossum hirsutum]|uniref:diphosphoinositol-polyphosphate diphosphatase n=1 Tax=Trichoglossum hirsutum TaxID=265104 RepID=A0A9P8LAQ9_9PEZI|nr:hypothetical protein GP486_004641 [Trichoglossum hirsutum]